VSDTVTVLRARGRRLGKRIRADGTIEAYDNARSFDLIEIAVAGLDDIQELLRRLERCRNCGIVRGAISDPARTRGVRRLLYPDGADQPTLREVPRRWLALDIDTLPRPEWIAIDDLVSCGRLAIETLPTEYRRARFIVQATGGHGLKPGVRMRLWCWLSRAVGGGELKHWLRRSPVDPSVFGPANIIYTAPPVIEPGAFDPLTTRLEPVPGHEGEVLVPAPEQLRRHRPCRPSVGNRAIGMTSVGSSNS